MKTAGPTSRPIDISPEVAAKSSGPDQFKKFDNLFRNLITVPKSTIADREHEWKRAKTKKRVKRP